MLRIHETSGKNSGILRKGNASPHAADLITSWTEGVKKIRMNSP